MNNIHIRIINIIKLPNKMTDLSNITPEQIETKLMMILINNKDQLLVDKYLYNQLLDKLDYNNGFICPNFKNKFFMVLQSLDSNKDIKIIKNNDVYRAVYSENLDSYTKDTPVSNFNYQNHFTDSSFIDLNYDPLTFTEYLVSQNSDSSKLSTYKDLENGNTIYHDLIKHGSYEIIQKMLNTESINIDVKNNFNLTPIDYINDIRIARLFIKDLYLINKKVNSKLDNLIEKVEDLTQESAISKNNHDKNNMMFEILINSIVGYLFVIFFAYFWKFF
jgi:hypothetical protein